MDKKPTYEELEQRAKELEKEAVERNRAEENLRLQSEVAENMAEGVYLIRTSDGTIVYANKTFERMFGYDPGELVGKHVSTVNAPSRKRPEEIADEIIQSLKESGTWSGEVENIKKDGTRFWCHANVSTFDHHDFGEVWVSVHDNITERKRAREALRREKEFAESLLETAQAIVLVLDKEGRIVVFNPYMEEISGYKNKEVQGKDWFSTFLPERDYSRIRELFKKALGDIQTRGNISPIITKDGQERRIEWYDKTLKAADGSIIGLLAIGQDVTEKLRAEEQIGASLKEKEVLLAEVHHRVKNNFQIISSLLDMIKIRTRNQEAIGLLTGARSKIYTMALVHMQLYEQGRFDQVDMTSHVEKLVDYLSQVYSGEGIAINQVIEPSDVYLTLNQAIPCALVLNEIVSNAFKHAFRQRQRGTIEISVRGAADDMVVISVKDDGIGIPEEVDIDKTNTLGLKLVRNLVEGQLNGEEQINRGNGTEVIIEFKSLKEGGKHA